MMLVNHKVIKHTTLNVTVSAWAIRVTNHMQGTKEGAMKVDKEEQQSMYVQR